MNKELNDLAPGARPYIVAVVAFKWLGLLATIVVMEQLGWVFQNVLAGVRAVPWQALGLVLACACARAACGALAARMGDKAACVAKAQVRDAVMAKLLRLAPSYQEQCSTAEAMQLAVEGAEQLQVYFGAFLPQVVFALLAPVTLFAALAGVCLPASVVMVCGVVLVPGLIFGVRKAARVAANVYWGSYGDLSTMFLEDIQGLTTLKVFGADEARHALVDEEAQKFRSATMGLLSVQLRSIVGMDLVVYAGAAAGIVVALVQLAGGQIGFAAAFSVVFLAQEFFLPMRTLGSLFHSAMNGIAASERMMALLAMDEPVQGGRGLEDCAGFSLACENLGYSYDGQRQVLHQVDAVFAQGGLYGVVGESGTGKSTLAGVLGGRLDRYSGRVVLGGVDVRDLSAQALARAVCVVPTNAYLFAGTVRENLVLGHVGQDATDEELWRALDDARAAGFVRAMGGLDAPVAEAGGNVSGGQRQRLALARALLAQAPVYVFDEATSNIDVESEAAIGQAIAALAGKATVIVISHRLSLVKDADEIFVLQDGRVAEHAAHEALLEARGPYWQLWESQQALERLAGELAQEGGPADVPAAPDVPAAAAADAADPADAIDPADPGSAVPSPEPGPAAPRRPLAVFGALLDLLGPLAPWMALAITLGVLGHLAAIFITTFGAYGLARGVARFAGADLMLLCVAVAACGVLRGPLRYGEQLTNHYIAFSVLAHVRSLVYGALRRLAPAKLEGRAKGDLVSLATGDIELLEVFYAHTISPVAIALVVSVAMCAFIARMSWQLALLALAAYVVVGVLLPWAAAKATAGLGQRLREGAGQLNAFTLESLRGLRELLQFGGAPARARELHERTAAHSEDELRLRRISNVVAAVADVAIVVADLCMLVAALGLYQAGQIGFVDALVCTCALMASFGPVVAVMRLGGGLANTVGAGQRVLALLAERPQTPDVEDGLVPAFASAAAEGVTFGYGAAPVLHNVSFAVPAGKVVALEGASGAGKSTMLKLLMRFWDVDAGRVAYDGADVRQVQSKALRAHVGYMTQDTHLFAGSIGENILLARPDATPGQLRDACEKARILKLVDSLPQGFQTPVGELGGVLSGGERQRIGLARIFLQDAPFMFLDEPTSNLDALNEAAVVEAIRAGREGKTVVIVSHRASTAAFADVHVRIGR